MSKLATASDFREFPGVLEQPSLSSHVGQRLDGHGRLIVRPSGTEPVIRVMGEGDDKVLVEEVVDEIVDALTNAA